MSAAVRIPGREDLTENEVVIAATSPVDDLGRAQFHAFWLDDYLTPDGVRGQVFHTDVAAFVRREADQGRKVTALDESTQAILDGLED